MNKETRKKALIIAISNYDDKQLRSLEFCKNDGEEMYHLLGSLGFDISENHKLIGYIQFNRMRDAIYDFFDNRKTKADDTLLFYYSGHGIPISDGNILASSETDYYSPRKMGFSSYDLTNLIQESNSIRIVEVLDCCYGGAAKIGKGSEEDAAKLGIAAMENNAKQLQQGEGKFLLAASQATEEAFGLRERGHSIFTYYLLEGLRGNEESVNSEGNVTPDSLGNYVYREILNLPGKGPKQKPIRKTEASGEIILASYPQLKRIKAKPFANWIDLEDENDQTLQITHGGSWHQSSAKITKQDWDSLVHLIRRKKCTPIIGDRVSASFLPLPSEIANEWAKVYGYPFRDSQDLAKVSQFMAISHFDQLPKLEIADLIQKAKTPDFLEANEIHSFLADLDLPIYITTNYDDFMEKALQSRGKKPIRDFVHWNNFLLKLDASNKTKSPLENDYHPTIDNPVVYHICGQAEIPESIVITEEDYKKLLSLDLESLLPSPVKTAMTVNALLFIGYSIGNSKLDILVKWVKRYFSGMANLGLIVHPRPKGKHLEEQSRYVVKYFAGIENVPVEIYWGTVKSFCLKLRQHLEGDNNT